MIFGLGLENYLNYLTSFRLILCVGVFCMLFYVLFYMLFFVYMLFYMLFYVFYIYVDLKSSQATLMDLE